MDTYILVGAIALMLIIGFAFTYSKGKHTPKSTQGIHTTTPAPKQPRKEAPVTPAPKQPRKKKDSA